MTRCNSVQTLTKVTLWQVCVLNNRQKQQVKFVWENWFHKMGWKSSLAIHLGFWLYLVGGGIIYYFIENPGYHLPPVEKRKTIRRNALFLKYVCIPCLFRFIIVVLNENFSLWLITTTFTAYFTFIHIPQHPAFTFQIFYKKKWANNFILT